MFFPGYAQHPTIIMAFVEDINPVSKSGSSNADSTRASSPNQSFAASRLGCITEQSEDRMLSYIPPTRPCLTGSLVTQNSRGFFEDNYETIFRSWVSLLKETTLPYNTTSSDKHVINAFRVINNVFENPNTPPLLLRLAYIRFSNMIKTLQVIAHNDRKCERINTAVGHRNASIAVDICLDSQQTLGRKGILRRMRHAKRWACLIGLSPLALAICLEEAEGMM
ncbi:hypothetical protein F5883DRAFT_701976, partial [Diaporthe sp. PMI_573]